MEFHNIKGIVPHVRYDNGKVTCNELINGLIHDSHRNHLIGLTMGRSYKSRFIVLTNSDEHLDLIENETNNEKIHWVRIDKLVFSTEIHTHRITGMTFKTLENIINNSDICDDIKCALFSQTIFFIVIPQNSIDNITTFIHGNKLHSLIFYMDDYYELFEIWTKYHEDKIKRLNAKYRRVSIIG